MSISEVIKALEEILLELGDVDVKIFKEPQHCFISLEDVYISPSENSVYMV